MNSTPSSQRKSLVILVASPLTDSIYNRIGAEALANHCDVWVLDCLHLIRSKASDVSVVRSKASNIVEVSTFEELHKQFQKIKPEFSLDFIGRGPFTRPIQNVCIQYDTKYITHHLVPIPGSTLVMSPLIHLLRSPLSVTRRIINHLRNRILDRNPLPPDIALIAGEHSKTPWIETSKHIIQTASNSYFDLQKARERLEKTDIFRIYKDKEFILFIDDCLAHSFDFALGGFKPIIEASRYQRIICNFFDQLEEQTGIQIVIAAHQNGKEIPGYEHLFGGRPVYFDSTAILTLLSKATLTHYSSAIHFPILEGLPVTLLTFDSLEKAEQAHFPTLFSQMLQRPLVNIEHFQNQNLAREIFKAVNPLDYEKFIKDYILSTPNPGNNSFENLGLFIELGNN